MNFAIPWIISRRRKIIGMSIDCFVNIYLYNFIFNKEIGLYPNQYVSVSLALFWIKELIPKHYFREIAMQYLLRPERVGMVRYMRQK